MSNNPGQLSPANPTGAANAPHEMNVPPGTNPQPETLDSSAFLVVFTWIAAGFLALGLLAILLYSLQDIHHFFSVFTTALLLAFATLALGLLAGFIFGIPSTPKQEPPANPPAAPRGSAGTMSQSMVDGQPLVDSQPWVGRQPEAGGSPWAGQEAEALPGLQPYRPNTNLEKISDWLATILVGIGLTQLLKLPAALEAFGNKIKPALGNTDAAAWVAIGILLLYTIIGFLLSFLWTRVKIPELYAMSDIRQKMLYVLAKGKEAGRVEGWSEGVPQGERQAIEAMASVQPPAAEDFILKGLPGDRTQAPPAKHILWVDNQPENNQGLRQLLAARLNVDFEICTSTAEALNKMSPRFDLVISDMSRPGDRRAGFTLLQELKRQGYSQPYLIYAGIVEWEQDVQAKVMGAYGVTASPVQLMSLVEKVLNG